MGNWLRLPGLKDPGGGKVTNSIHKKIITEQLFSTPGTNDHFHILPKQIVQSPQDGKFHTTYLNF